MYGIQAVQIPVIKIARFIFQYLKILIDADVTERLLQKVFN